MSASVCLSVCLFARISQEPHDQIFDVRLGPPVAALHIYVLTAVLLLACVASRSVLG